MVRHEHGKNCDIAVASYAKQFLGPNVIFMRDVYGNNALHLCVMRCKVDMYKHVLEKADAQLRIEIRAAYLKELDQVTYVKLDLSHSSQPLSITLMPTLIYVC